ncbi:TPA: recombinase family protein [Clostridioides difficile]
MGENRAYGYVRVSTKEQNVDRQVQALKEYGIEDRNILIDRVSGKDFNRPSYKVLKESILRKGDKLVIKELDRLGRNMNAIKQEWQDLIDMGIDIVILDTPVLNTNNKTNLEKSLISNIIFELLSYLGEKERLKIRARQREGIELLKEKNNGKGIGRPKINFPQDWEEVYKSWKNGVITAKVAMQKLELKKSTFYKLVHDWEKDKKD